jgi:hypothetical protein
MIQMFFLQPCDKAALQKAKEKANEYEALFYVAPLEFQDMTDANCVGFYVTKHTQLHTQPVLDKPLFIDENDLDETLHTLLKKRSEKGVILNATQAHKGLANFLIAIGAENIDAFTPESLSVLSMDKIALQSGYPDYDFDAISSTVKKLSDGMFRPEQSIIARATKHLLQMTGFKK